MAWRIAKSLDVLLAQINEAAPNRSKSSDGGIGDAAHASRSSDHNPWVRDSRGIGVVTARDFTHDPADGCDCQALVDSLVASGDARIKYIIWNRQIINSSNWLWRPYTGANPHNHHAHVSVKDNPALYDSDSPWQLTLPPADPSVPKMHTMPVLRKGDRGSYVTQLQGLLGIEADGIFGPGTQAAVQAVQRQYGLVADGVVGAYTWTKLLP